MFRCISFIAEANGSCSKWCLVHHIAVFNADLQAVVVRRRLAFVVAVIDWFNLSRLQS